MISSASVFIRNMKQAAPVKCYANEDDMKWANGSEREGAVGWVILRFLRLQMGDKFHLFFPGNAVLTFELYFLSSMCKMLIFICLPWFLQQATINQVVVRKVNIASNAKSLTGRHYLCKESSAFQNLFSLTGIRTSHTYALGRWYVYFNPKILLPNVYSRVWGLKKHLINRFQLLPFGFNLFFFQARPLCHDLRFIHASGASF